LSVGYSGVFLPNQLEEKYKNAARELAWQWFFPSKQLTFDKKNNEQRRYHVHESLLQKSLGTAVKKSKVLKRVTSHTFRYSFASYLLQANYDIRTIQELMGAFRCKDNHGLHSYREKHDQKGSKKPT
jgi:integrase